MVLRVCKAPSSAILRLSATPLALLSIVKMSPPAGLPVICAVQPL
jgi:hypothetical protein